MTAAKKLKRYFPLLLAACAAGVTLAIVAVDHGKARSRQMNDGLQLARQVASQAEGLTLSAREDGVKDPAAWAIRHLAQGIEPRVIQISKLSANNMSANEAYAFDEANRILEYSKLSFPESQDGFKVQIRVPYRGFLGAQSRFESDFLGFVLFALILSNLFLAFARKKSEPDLKENVLNWIAEAKPVLTRLSVHVRDTVKEAHRLAMTVGQSRSSVENLRNHLHVELSNLHENRASARAVSDAATKAEQRVQGLIKVFAKPIPGIDAPMAAALLKDMQCLVSEIQEMKRTDLAAESALQAVATDADLAFHAFDDVIAATEDLNQQINHTKGSLLGQAAMIQKLNARAIK